MSLIDEVTIRATAGRGGDGARAFLSSPGTTKKKPDGGSGGNGGNIYFQASSNVSDLSEFRFKKEIKGNDGSPGARKTLTGAKGEDITVFVPPGTTLTDEEGTQIEILDLTTPVLVARGGRGGIGNFDYRKVKEGFDESFYKGIPGESKTLSMNLRLIADIGLIGLPNAGKSSLLSSLTNARPKIGNYPFTTTEPNLGICEGVILADIPGLIEGASQGKGLGIQFLKHIEKTKVLFHCIDATEPDPVKTYRTVRAEFEKYASAIQDKEEIILLTKKDLVDEGELHEKTVKLETFQREIIPVSIYEEGLLYALRSRIKTYKS